MKTIMRTGLLAALLMLSGIANAGWSANIGYASEYYFRGVPQKNSSASGGVDYESDGGFYVGTWAADVGDGLEVDGYLGYGTTVGDVDLSIGYTGYFYTGDFDTEYHEINLGAGYGIFSLDVALAQHEVDDGSDEDITYYALTAEKNGFYGTFAGFAQDWEGEYLEFGYGTTVAGIDLGLALIIVDEIAIDVDSETPVSILSEDDEVVLFTIGKTFDLQ